MNELDELKSQWADVNRRLDASLRLNHQALSAVASLHVQQPLRRFAMWLVLESLLAAPVLMLLGNFAYNHLLQPLFLVPALGLMAFVIVCLNASIRHAIMARGIDPTLPVAEMQKRIERLRIAHIRYTKWVFILATLMWTPLMIVMCKAIGFSAYDKFGWPYVLANLGLGLAIIPLGIWLSKMFSERMDGSPFLQKLLRDLAGTNLNQATDNLKSMEAFTGDAA